MEETDEPSERLFRVSSRCTLRREVNGRTRRYDGVPVDWVVTQVPEEDDLRRENAALELFTRAEALQLLRVLEEEHPEDEHQVESLPSSTSEGPLREGPPHRSPIVVEPPGELDVTGYAYPEDADRYGWEREDGTFLVETTLELPVEMAERLEGRDEARYIKQLEELAENVSEAPTPDISGAPDPDLPF